MEEIYRNIGFTVVSLGGLYIAGLIFQSIQDSIPKPKNFKRIGLLYRGEDNSWGTPCGTAEFPDKSGNYTTAYGYYADDLKGPFLTLEEAKEKFGEQFHCSYVRFVDAPRG